MLRKIAKMRNCQPEKMPRFVECAQLGGKAAAGLPSEPPPVAETPKTPCASEDAQLPTPKKRRVFAKVRNSRPKTPKSPRPIGN